MAKNGRPTKVPEEIINLIKQKAQEGKTSSAIAKELLKEKGINLPERTIRVYNSKETLKEDLKKAATELLHQGGLQTTLQHEIEETAARKKFLLTQAAKIWEQVPDKEKNKISVFFKLIELAQKDSEMLVKVLGLPEPTPVDEMTIKSSLEQKLGLLDEPNSNK